MPARILPEIVLIGLTGLLPYISNAIRTYDTKIKCEIDEECDCSEQVYNMSIVFECIGLWFSPLIMVLTIRSLYFMCDVGFEKRKLMEAPLTNNSLHMQFI